MSVVSPVRVPPSPEVATHSAVQTLAAAHLRGRTLSQAAYVDPDVFAADLALVFGTSWLFVAASTEVGSPRDHLA
jgi:hypothetical protein